MYLKNCKVSEFSEIMGEAEVICFGAGTSGQLFAKQFGEKVLNQIQFFVDNDEKKWKAQIEIKQHVYEIKSPDVLKRIDSKKTIILITSRFWDQIHVQLESIHQLAEVRCYVYLLMKAKCSSDKYIIPEGSILIPKKIHYCWFGKSTMSENEIRCIESWKRFCPDYEIIKWDESNYDCRKTRYLTEVYDYGHYSAVSSYARFDLLYEIGGIYLDTDVEIIKNIDELLRLPAYMGFEVADVVNTGHGFGGAKGNQLYKEIIDYYDTISHYNDNGEFCYTNCPIITSRILEKHGLLLDGKMQQVEDITVFSNEYFDPVMQMPVENTYSIHRYSSLWSINGADMAGIWKNQREYWRQLRSEEII